MKVLLLAGYRHDDNLDFAPGLARAADGTLALDRRITEIRALGLEVICVVSGEAADRQIRESRHLSDVELVYDNNAPDVSLATNLRAGLAALLKDEPCLVLPVELPCPPAPTWTRLTHAAYEAGPRVTFARVDHGKAADDFGFPLLVTRFGVKEFTRLTDVKSLADTRLETYRPTI